MAEYIEREALIRYLKEKKEALENIDCVNMAKDIGRIIKHIEKDKIPVADVVEVVRCKDCVHYCGFEHCKNGICDMDSVSKRAVYPNDFCSYDERRDNTERQSVSLINGHIDKSNRCVSCGAEIPEGTWTCPSCDRRWG